MQKLGYACDWNSWCRICATLRLGGNEPGMSCCSSSDSSVVVLSESALDESCIGAMAGS